VSYQLKLSN
jgi:hypothetical protein